MRTFAVLLACAAPAAAQDFQIGLPIDCVLGETCYIQNYVDRDPSEAASDFQCGSLSYDTHKGTDFGLPSLAAMESGVDVLASAAGTVRGVRSDMRDVIYTSDLAGEINGRDCGNGVVIAHEDGWETQYCHMKEGSVTVLSGDHVEAGDVLGEVGLSGRTQFPHVHISVRRNGAVVDPFAPNGQITCGEPPSETLWAQPIATPEGGILDIGFSNSVPEYTTIKSGTASVQTLTHNAPIVLWAFAFGARVGDTVTISFDGPDGPLFQTDDVLDRQQALFMRAGGLNPPDAGWSVGTYTGLVIHARDGVVLDRQSTTISLH
ncbi:M23 family metallopeptidase [Octadecabacter ascidiaceicola]|uniref:Putative peptidase n=1 Tax=Octadecabacter ascidiaceicola TaxID=1655543 RepID=A0A238K4J8_9RHOB|nr:M23 family metallopeptidase [Octadecabacter ascidiaceicola]SMX36866.1 putative peptidase [Octadecabacter ascidiaceicola]